MAYGGRSIQGNSDARIDVTQPLGLGWRSSLPAEALSSAGPEPELTRQQGSESQPLIAEAAPEGVAWLSVTDSQVSWTQSLRLSHQLEGRLPLQQVVANMRMSGVAPRLRLLLAHDGYELDRSQAQQNTETALYGPQPQLGGIDWPLNCSRDPAHLHMAAPAAGLSVRPPRFWTRRLRSTGWKLSTVMTPRFLPGTPHQARRGEAGEGQPAVRPAQLARSLSRSGCYGRCATWAC